MTVKEWMDKHPDARLMVKYGILFIGGLALTYAALYIAQGKVPMEYAAFFSMAVAYLNEKFRLLNPLEPWPILGARKK